MLFGGYGLHYEVWLSYFGDTIVSFGRYIFIMVYGSLIWAGYGCSIYGTWCLFWSVVVLFGGMVMLFWVISVARPSLGLGRHG